MKNIVLINEVDKVLVMLCINQKQRYQEKQK